MQNIQDLKDRIFFESHSIIESLEKISTLDELIVKQDMVEELLERITFLKYLEKNKDYFTVKQEPSYTNEPDYSDVEELNYGVTEEEAIFNNELNEIGSDGVQEAKHNNPTGLLFATEEPEIQSVVSEPHVDNLEIITEHSPVEVIIEDLKDPIISEKQLVEADQDFIVEEQIHIQDAHNELPNESHEEKRISEQKIKLASIKSLKPQDETPVDAPISKVVENPMPSIVAEVSVTPQTTVTPFKLDLNDRIAFSKMLFGGSQTELNDVVHTLNSFNTIDEAKEYLSDMYYEKNWANVDEYAQRLWSLVENKFL